jgi:hypothetical protein
MAWTVHQREIDGKVAQILIDDHFAAQAPVKDLIYLSGVSIFCRQQPVNTLWHPDEGDTLDNIEDQLLHLCEKFSNGWSVYALRMATYGVREYYFYHSAAAELSKAIAELQRLRTDYRIEFATISDPEWVEYRKYLNVG